MATIPSRAFASPSSTQFASIFPISCDSSSKKSTKLNDLLGMARDSRAMKNASGVYGVDIKPESSSTNNAMRFLKSLESSYPELIDANEDLLIATGTSFDEDIRGRQLYPIKNVSNSSPSRGRKSTTQSSRASYPHPSRSPPPRKVACSEYTSSSESSTTSPSQSPVSYAYTSPHTSTPKENLRNPSRSSPYPFPQPTTTITIQNQARGEGHPDVFASFDFTHDASDECEADDDDDAYYDESSDDDDDLMTSFATLHQLSSSSTRIGAVSNPMQNYITAGASPPASGYGYLNPSPYGAGAAGLPRANMHSRWSV